MQSSTLRLVIRGVAVFGLLLIMAPFFIYFVDQREMVVVLQLGKPVRQATAPGLYWKFPMVESIRRMPNTKQFWGGSSRDVMPDLPTKDDKKIELIPWAVWKINNPTVFVTRLRTVENAENRVAQIVRGAVRDVITQYDLAELVRSSDRALRTAQMDLEGDVLNLGGPDGSSLRTAVPTKIETGRVELLRQIKERAKRELASGGEATDDASQGRGIELVEIGISQIDFVRSVREKTFDRWITEREAISARNINEGERQKQEILNQTNSEVASITGEGQQKSNTIRGQIDAEVIKRYADAIQQTGDFYTFVRTLEAYEKSIQSDTRLILTTDSEFFQMLHKLEPSSIAPKPASILPK